MEKRCISFLFVVLLTILIGINMINALVLTVNEPNKTTYGSGEVMINLSADNESDFFYIRDSHGWFKFLSCDNQKECSSTLKFREGDNEIYFKAISNSGESNSKNVSFKVDTLIPKIKATSPKNNAIINGSEFLVRYSEENLKQIDFIYQNQSGGINNLSNSTCESGTNKKCVFNVNLSYLDGQEILYWFNVSDNINTTESIKRKVRVDTSPPKNISQSYEIEKRRINFVFEIQEDNFDRVSYIDLNDKNPKLRTLCSSLKYGRCSVKVSFKPGVHRLDIITTDKAGNKLILYNNEIILI